MDRSDLIKYLNNEAYRVNARILFGYLLESYNFLKQHKPSLGNFGEYILRDFLKTILPHDIGVTQGFVQGMDGDFSSQCDIIIYKKTSEAIVKTFGDIHIISNQSVLLTIEVKTRIQRKTFRLSVKAFKKLAKMGCRNNYIFVYNAISPEALCSYFYPKINDEEDSDIKGNEIYDHGDQYHLPIAICNLQSNYYLCQDYVINERDEFGYTAYQLKDDNGEMSCLQMFIGEIINSCCSNDKSTDNEVLANINFDDLRILYSKGLWQL